MLGGRIRNELIVPAGNGVVSEHPAIAAIVRSAPAQLCWLLVDLWLVWIRHIRLLDGIEKHSKFLITEFSKSAIRSDDTNGIQPPCGNNRQAVA
jgi:hypothetical protein